MSWAIFDRVGVPSLISNMLDIRYSSILIKCEMGLLNISGMAFAQEHTNMLMNFNLELQRDLCINGYLISDTSGSRHHEENKKLFSGGIGKTDSLLEKNKIGPLHDQFYIYTYAVVEDTQS